MEGGLSQAIVLYYNFKSSLELWGRREGKEVIWTHLYILHAAVEICMQSLQPNRVTIHFLWNISSAETEVRAEFSMF